MSADRLAEVRSEVRQELRRRLDARGLASVPPAERRLHVREEALTLLREQGVLLPQRELARMVNQVSDEVVGFGPIESLLKDPTVTEVMVNGPDDVFVEREGRLERVEDRLFEGEGPVLHLMGREIRWPGSTQTSHGECLLQRRAGWRRRINPLVLYCHDSEFGGLQSRECGSGLRGEQEPHCRPRSRAGAPKDFDVGDHLPWVSRAVHGG